MTATVHAPDEVCGPDHEVAHPYARARAYIWTPFVGWTRRLVGSRLAASRERHHIDTSFVWGGSPEQG
jgi:hypothetical protein